MTTLALLAALAWHWTPPTPDLPPGLVPAIVLFVRRRLIAGFQCRFAFGHTRLRCQVAERHFARRRAVRTELESTHTLRLVNDHAGAG